MAGPFTGAVHFSSTVCVLVKGARHGDPSQMPQLTWISTHIPCTVSQISFLLLSPSSYFILSSVLWFSFLLKPVVQNDQAYGSVLLPRFIPSPHSLSFLASSFFISSFLVFLEGFHLVTCTFQGIRDTDRNYKFIY